MLNVLMRVHDDDRIKNPADPDSVDRDEIGRASCRERV